MAKTHLYLYYKKSKDITRVTTFILGMPLASLFLSNKRLTIPKSPDVPIGFNCQQNGTAQHCPLPLWCTSGQLDVNCPAPLKSPSKCWRQNLSSGIWQEAGLSFIGCPWRVCQLEHSLIVLSVSSKCICSPCLLACQQGFFHSTSFRVHQALSLLPKRSRTHLSASFQTEACNYTNTRINVWGEFLLPISTPRDNAVSSCHVIFEDSIYGMTWDDSAANARQDAK